ncbi:MAG: STT3 domain-containing protein [Candidatus Hydrothermarchaeota archaeon]|nr:STT3 domain-containing protein [Candidatus Hydrothermarchaeota archaeon]
MNKFKELAVLAAVVSVAFALRIATYKYYLLGTDEFVYYKIGEYILENNEFPYMWYLSSYPEGGGMGQAPLLYYASVFFYNILKFFGFSFHEAFKLAAPIAGALTLVSVYLLAKHIFDRRIAFYSLAILAVLPAFSYRTFAGFYRGDTFSVFFMVLGFYFFLLSLGSDTKKSVKFSILAGLSFGFMGLVWNGFLFGFIVLSGFVVFYSLFAYQAKSSRQLLLSYAMAAGLGILIIKYSLLLQPRGAESYLRDLVRYVYPATLALAGGLEFLKIKTGHLDARRRAYILLFAAAVSLAAVPVLFPQLLENLLTGYGGVEAATVLFRTITELQPTTIDMAWESYHVALVLFVPGLLLLFKQFYEKKSEGALFMIVWILASLFVLKTAVRYSFLASIPLAIAGGFFIGKIKQLKAVPYIVLLILTFHGIAFAGSVKPHMNDEWRTALTSLKNEDEGVVLTWWAHGSWVQGVAGFPTVVDTLHGQSTERINEIGRIFLETNESKTLDFLRKYRVKYVVVSTEIVMKIPYISELLNTTGLYYNIAPHSGIDEGILTYKDESGNIYAIKKIYKKERGRLAVREYSEAPIPFYPGEVYVSQGEVSIPDFSATNFVVYIPPKLQNTLLTSLMFLDGSGFESYKLIYSNSQVRIYKAVYEHTFVIPENFKPSYRVGEDLKFDVRVESTVPFKGVLGVVLHDSTGKGAFTEHYNVTENSVQNINISLPDNSPVGNYRLLLLLYDDKGNQLDSMWRVIRVRK